MRSHSHDRAHGHSHREAETRGIVLDGGRRYDLRLWVTDTFLLRGSLRALRRRVIDLTELDGGGSVLDVGCGTGTLALELAERLGAAGRVAGIDPASSSVARARAKASRKDAAIDFQVAPIEALPFADASFEAVTSTLMMHHLPGDVKEAGLAEILRVLTPGGRLVVADFTGPAFTEAGGHFGDPDDLEELLGGAGFVETVREDVSFRRAHRRFGGAVVVRGRKPQ